jgi:hypothetical protein
VVITVVITSKTQINEKELKVMKEICPRGNNNIVIIIFLVHDNVYIPC